MDLLFKRGGTCLTPYNTYRADVYDNGSSKYLGSYATKKEANDAVYSFKENRLVSVCKDYGHDIDDGVIINGYYIIFDNGDIFNVDTARRIKPHISEWGYQIVVLNNQTYYLHRLVAETFIPNPYDKQQVNHIDGNKTNNHATNLEWVTPSENVRHSIVNNLRNSKHLVGENNHQHKLSYEDVETIRTIYIPGDKRYGQNALARTYGVSTATITSIIHRTTWA